MEELQHVEIWGWKEDVILHAQPHQELLGNYASPFATDLRGIFFVVLFYLFFFS